MIALRIKETLIKFLLLTIILLTPLRSHGELKIVISLDASSNSLTTLPSGVEMSQGINRFVSPPMVDSCLALERNDDLLKFEESTEEDLLCEVEEGESYTEFLHKGIRHLIPNRIDSIAYITECIDEEFDKDYSETENENDFDNYSKSEEVIKMINVLRSNTRKCLASKNKYICKRQAPRNRKERSKPTGYCLRYVKLGIVGGGFTNQYPSGVAAKKSGNQWKKMGLRNLLDDKKYEKMTAYDAPKGAILVYSGGKWGHVEVKASESEYISDYIGEKPIYDELNLPRKLIGIYVK